MKGEGSWVEGSEKRRGGLRRKGRRGANERRARGNGDGRRAEEGEEVGDYLLFTHRTPSLLSSPSYSRRERS